MDFYTSIKNLYKQIYFNIEESFPEISWDRIVSNKVLQLPASCLNEAQGFISAFYKLSQTASYQEATGLKKQFPFDENIKNHSLLMAYDFHVDDQNNLKLIEVNTNASGYLLADLVYTSMSNTSSLDSLKSSFLSELELSHHPSEKKIFIVDENISQQKMIFEFYMYKALFEQWGFNSKIVEFSQLHWDDSKKALFDNDQPVDFIYNRYCDFLLQKEVSSHLLNGFSQNVTLSPNPIHYFLLADKERLLELSDPLWAEQMLDQKALSLYEKIKDNLILTYP
ncbi:MAG: hypothetical protein KDD50_13075, partial [Bdellovibrionales bacterium]|nr:hypothetical protein [Bdellovibrionales bacterium]